ncbi:bifunctional tRNA (5-methylaminomethyl-2-thiouridine)(34)-methyltransferase MnmD/FAD-dependent 5-carboxymethylaminomethyl-2-thiouridine(34) oxidoreductase MnmC [Photobacterium kishitanii]|uniref:bifunctional tRNA (5-methylaminomethyl-2-thiouridine)(34)-methyltransferase MnmD/FAD-dependent 5-carboxymethylaminomethyl-2-thiouridine(34) oxidoreductase MnmC n=1 Tax=Photobacterium kishitanii TaxID=318456 RepID=UPI00071AEC56|nr:bifunctional tRNA (5-methylaminomethyl-2-thiouridine)(34)-methyltransferase MnmD/FAD-dependent 5-carboxymethylaminomethyl-2-thiouridine(34) oxidoreductase MnmC [Photobacterium kishitanii]
MSRPTPVKSTPRIENAVLDWNNVGCPLSHDFNDIYFSNDNGLEETHYVFIKQNGLPERWHDFNRRRFVVAETGFGTGLNFLTLWQTFKAFREQHPHAATKELHYISFEKYPLTKPDLIKAHLAWPELAELTEQLHAHYPPAVADCHRIVLEDGMITLDLWFGDIHECMPQVWVGNNGIVDAWFLDGFAPKKNPEMWSQDLFNGMANMARPECSIATFTAAGFVRRGLSDAGFDIKKAKGFGVKRHMTVGTITNRHPQANFKPWFARSPQQTQQSDIAIIGGGVASATTALALIRRGQSVSLYCADSELAQGASGNRQGAVYPLLNGKHDPLSRFFGPGFIYARQFVEQAAQQCQFDHDWCGVTQLAWDENGKNLTEAEKQLALATKDKKLGRQTKKLDCILNGGFPEELVRALDIEQTRAITGVETDCRSINYPLGGWLCPQQLTQALIESAVNTGKLSLHLNSDVTELEQIKSNDNSDQWQLTFADGTTVNHTTVIVASGHRFNHYPQTAPIPTSSVRGQVSHVPTNDKLAELETVLCYDGYLTPANIHTKSHCVGASYARRNCDLDYNEADQQQNKQRLLDSVPATASWIDAIDVDEFDPQQRARVGVRCASRDHLPFVGNVCRYDELIKQYQDLKDNQLYAQNVPVYKNLFAIVGLGSRGLSSAPLLGELLASQICGDPLPLPHTVLDALHPGRMWVRKLVRGKELKS